MQPDERPEIGHRWEYADNSTERMLVLLAEAEFCLAAVGDRGVIAFHDAWVTSVGIRRFLDLAPEGTVGFTMPDGLFVADIGGRACSMRLRSAGR